jgi:hypothetical protein
MNNPDVQRASSTRDMIFFKSGWAGPPVAGDATVPNQSIQKPLAGRIAAVPDRPCWK